MEQNKKKKIIIAVSAGVVALAIAATAFVFFTQYQNNQKKDPAPTPVSASVFPQGTTLGGEDLSGKTEKEALAVAKSALEKARDTMEITVRYKDDTVSLAKDDFVLTDLYELTIPKMLQSGQGGAYELSYVTDLSEKGKQKLVESAGKCFSQGKDATVSGYDAEAGAFTFTDEQKGSRVDMVKTQASVRQLMSQKHGGAIQAAFTETAPKITKKYLSENFKQLSSYSTVSGNTENGNHNMALAFSKITGKVLNPGETFSYNGVVGDSTSAETGFLPAGGISGGVMVQMYGGGICQASSTLYIAALKAGMEIVERDCHSMPSSYVPIGLDATVDYGNIDFKFRNTHKTPIYISCWMDGVTLYTNFYGCLPEEWDSIEVYSEQTGTESPLSDVSFTVDQSLAKGQYVRKSSGNTGYSAAAYRTFYKGENTVRTEQLPSSYYEPTGKVYAVGEGTDTSKVDTGKESGSTDPVATPTPAATPTAAPNPTPTPPTDPTPEPPEEPTPEPPAPPEEPTPEPPTSSGVIDWS